MMWLANKLYNLNEDNNITLSSAYNKYLENNIGNFNYWNLLRNQEDFKDTNLRYMSELYTLLKHICNTIAYYKKNKKIENLRQYSLDCLNKYRSLYKTFSGDDSHLDLLEKLKKIYDDFRTSAINDDTDEKNNIKNRLQELTPINEIDSHSTNNLKTLDSNDSNDQLEGEKKPEIPKEKSTLEEQKNPKIEGKNDEQSTELQNSVNQTPSQREEQSVTNDTSKISGNEPENSGKSQEDSEEQAVVQEKTPEKPQPEPPPGPQQQTVLSSANSESSSQQDPSTPSISPSGTEEQKQRQSTSAQEKPLTKLVTGFLNDSLKPYFLSFYDTLTEYGNRLYGSASTSLTKGYSVFIGLANYLNTQPKDSGSNLPPSDSSSSSSSTEQTKTSESSQSPTVKINSDKTDQGKSQAQVPKPVITSESSVTEVKENGTTGIDVNILKKYKPIGISIIMLLIPIALAIMYKVNKKKTVKYTIFKIFLHYKYYIFSIILC